MAVLCCIGDSSHRRGERRPAGRGRPRSGKRGWTIGRGLGRSGRASGREDGEGAESAGGESKVEAERVWRGVEGLEGERMVKEQKVQGERARWKRKEFGEGAKRVDRGAGVCG